MRCTSPAGAGTDHSAVDCAAIPDHLFENEMFGHARGAYTDASTAQKGVIGLADHGTLFLDEVDSLSLPAQGKLLRFLEDRKYRPLGAEHFFDADIRILRPPTAASMNSLRLASSAETCTIV